MNEPIWQPTPLQIKNAQISAFMQQVNNTFHLDLNDYAAVYQWSIKNPADFWQMVTEFCDTHFSKPYERVYTPGDRMIDARWFVGGELNFAEHLLRHRNQHTAIISYDERGFRTKYTHAELYEAVAHCAAGLKNMGVKKGDVVAGIMPNIP
ncbi:MAG TPA: acetyl-coenzyme A synthetase N-terminal domain-containing protein, partial [Gammaproteobacteria bacterium]|nr:acetyl-coenzyme A synthetase N-terminal domain-containing protein [Gammaproteobacteria bacterium]